MLGERWVRSPASASRIRSSTAVYDTSLEVLFDILHADPHAQWVHFRDLRHDRVLATFLQHHAASPCTDGFALSRRRRSMRTALFQYGVVPQLLLHVPALHPGICEGARGHSAWRKQCAKPPPCPPEKCSG